MDRIQWLDWQRFFISGRKSMLIPIFIFDMARKRWLIWKTCHMPALHTYLRDALFCIEYSCPRLRHRSLHFEALERVESAKATRCVEHRQLNYLPTFPHASASHKRTTLFRFCVWPKPTGLAPLDYHPFSKMTMQPRGGCVNTVVNTQSELRKVHDSLRKTTSMRDCKCGRKYGRGVLMHKMTISKKMMPKLW